jgi:hypothetical protein
MVRQAIYCTVYVKNINRWHLLLHLNVRPCHHKFDDDTNKGWSNLFSSNMLTSLALATMNEQTILYKYISRYFHDRQQIGCHHHALHSHCSWQYVILRDDKVWYSMVQYVYLSASRSKYVCNNFCYSRLEILSIKWIQ